MKTETGTLKALNVKPGDVVKRKIDKGEPWIIKRIADGGYFGVKSYYRSNHNGCRLGSSHDDWMIISRDLYDSQMFSKMSDEEKAALLLAQYEGKTIQLWSDFEWIDYVGGIRTVETYRIRVKPEPVTETITLYGGVGIAFAEECAFSNYHTHYITFTTRDGEPVTGTFTNENGDVIEMGAIE